MHIVIYNGVRVEIELDKMVEYLAWRARRNKTRRARVTFGKAKVVADARYVRPNPAKAS